VTKELGGLPSIKYYCSILAVDALKRANESVIQKLKSRYLSGYLRDYHVKRSKP